MGQLANSLSTRNQGTLPGNTEKNPMEYGKAITLRSEIEVQPPKRTMEYEEKKKEEEKEQEDEWIEVQVKKEPGLKPSKHMVNTQVEGQKEDQKKEVKPYKPPAPYPKRLGKQEHVKKFTKFL